MRAIDMDVKIHVRARADYILWRRSLATTRVERDRLSTLYWEAFKTGIIASQGPPQYAMEAPNHGDHCYWCPFPPYYLALVKFRETPRLLGTRTYREAIVIEFNFSPGLPH
jgi:hypothetical protein